MSTYILLSEVTDEGASTIREHPERIKEVNEEIEKLGAEVKEQFAILGPYDFVNIVEAPDEETISRVSVELGSRGTVKIQTLTAIPIDDFIDNFEG
ncbi:MAG: GYD domain-containing protein [Candidatus Bipolaricaulota bacterium]|nr:GYD domain-containing protein [Candidatus Bipolaricaulota bacterium]MBS3792149.1 GYD domain-containing protein [Candidatus Bipolaricaulota bacterium]